MRIRSRGVAAGAVSALLALGVGGGAWATLGSDNPTANDTRQAIVQGVVTKDGQPVAGLSVSAGGEIVDTAADGSYKLDVSFATGNMFHIWTMSSAGQWMSDLYAVTATPMMGSVNTCNVELSDSTEGTDYGDVDHLYMVNKPCTDVSFTTPMTDDQLTEANRSEQAVVTPEKQIYVAGEAVTVSLVYPGSGATPNPMVTSRPGSLAGKPWAEGATVYGFSYSSPVYIGVSKVSSVGTVTYTLPKDLSVGSHKVAAYDFNGNLIGWTPITVAASTAAAATATPSAMPPTGTNAANPATLGAVGGLVAVGAALVLMTRRMRHTRQQH